MVIENGCLRLPENLAKLGQILCFLSLFCLIEKKKQGLKRKGLINKSALFQAPGLLVCQDLSIPSHSR